MSPEKKAVQSAAHPAFQYLAADASVLPSRVALSRREAFLEQYETLSLTERVRFRSALLETLGDPDMTPSNRTRLIELIPLVKPEGEYLSLCERLLLDDVRSLFRRRETPPVEEAADWIVRLRCLRDLRVQQSAYFWRGVYQLCGTLAALPVYAELNRLDPELASQWVTAAVSNETRTRIMSKTEPLARESADEVASRPTAMDGPGGQEWETLLQSVLAGSVSLDAANGSILRFLDLKRDRIGTRIEQLEALEETTLEGTFETWSRDPTETPVGYSARLLAWTRDYRSPRVLGCLIRALRGIVNRRKVIGSWQSEEAGKVGGLLIDSLQWFDDSIALHNAEIGGLHGEEPADIRGAVRQLTATLRVAAAIPDLAVPALRELVCYEPEEERRARALAALMTCRGSEAMDAVEDLDRRLGTDEFQSLVRMTLKYSEVGGEMHEGIRRLVEWCERTYTTRDAIAPGTGWALDSSDGEALYVAIVQLRDLAEFRDQMEAILEGCPRYEE